MSSKLSLILTFLFLAILLVESVPGQTEQRKYAHSAADAIQEIVDRMESFYLEPSQSELDQLSKLFADNIKRTPPNSQVGMLGSIVIGLASKKFKLEIKGDGPLFENARAVASDDKSNRLVKLLSDHKTISDQRMKAWWFSFFATGETEYLQHLVDQTGNFMADKFKGNRKFAMIANGDMMTHAFSDEAVANFCNSLIENEKDVWKKEFFKACVSWQKFYPEDYKEFNRDTPEGALRLFTLGVMTNNEDLIRTSVYPMETDELRILLSDRSPPSDLDQMKKVVVGMEYQRMKAGDTWETASGKKIKVPSKFDSERAVNAYLGPKQRGMPPFTIMKIYGQWWVDPAPLITVRKAAERVRKRDK